MKIIDLLNKIVNGEEMPQKIKYEEIIYYYCGEDQSGNCYFTRPKGYGGDWLHFDITDLGKKVEILEEENKIPEKLPLWATRREDKEYTKLEHQVLEVARKVDEIIDYIKSKGE